MFLSGFGFHFVELGHFAAYLALAAALAQVLAPARIPRKGWFPGL